MHGLPTCCIQQCFERTKRSKIGLLYLQHLAIQFPNSHMSNLAASSWHPQLSPQQQKGIEARAETSYQANVLQEIFYQDCLVYLHPCRSKQLYLGYRNHRGNCKHCKFQMFTYTTGTFRRISEQRYRHTEMAIPAMKFWYRRLSSLLGIKAAFNTPVISNTRYDSCIY